MVEVEVDSVQGCPFATQVKEFEDASDTGEHRHVVLCDRRDQPIHDFAAVASRGFWHVWQCSRGQGEGSG